MTEREAIVRMPAELIYEALWRDWAERSARGPFDKWNGDGYGVQFDPISGRCLLLKVTKGGPADLIDGWDFYLPLSGGNYEAELPELMRNVPNEIALINRRTRRLANVTIEYPPATTLDELIARESRRLREKPLRLSEEDDPTYADRSETDSATFRCPECELDILKERFLRHYSAHLDPSPGGSEQSPIRGQAASADHLGERTLRDVEVHWDDPDSCRPWSTRHTVLVRIRGSEAMTIWCKSKDQAYELAAEIDRMAE